MTHEKLGKVPEPNYALIDNFDIATSDPIFPPEPPIKPKPKTKLENDLLKFPELKYIPIDDFNIVTSHPITPPEPPIKPKTKPENELFKVPLLPHVPPWGGDYNPAEDFVPFQSEPEPKRELVIHPAGVRPTFPVYEPKKPNPFDIFLKEAPVKPTVKLDPKKVKESELIREETMRKINEDFEERAERAAARNKEAKSDS